MTFAEKAVVFDCNGEQLVGIIAVPEAIATDVGLLVIVGGPQYRAGSHRQFTLLCRELASHGVPTMRFDYRGMGDATGDSVPFDETKQDIRAALDAFAGAMINVKRFVLWGLCDGAAAASLYAGADGRVVGLALLNPWVRTEVARAKTYLRHYYVQRLVDRAFWRKLRQGNVALGAGIRDALALIRVIFRSRPKNAFQPSLTLPQRMSRSVLSRPVPLLIVLSERDYVAREFEQTVKAEHDWSMLFDRADVAHVSQADHTFSKRIWRNSVASATLGWLRKQQFADEGRDSGPMV